MAPVASPVPTPMEVRMLIVILRFSDALNEGVIMRIVGILKGIIQHILVKVDMLKLP